MTSATPERFGALPDGRDVVVFTLANDHGLELRVMTYGGTAVSVRTPDRAGLLDDVVLGFDRLESYLDDACYLGALIGRYANRIRDGRFALDGTSYQLETNDGPHHLHGGSRGFHRVLWDAEPFEAADGPGLRLRHTSPDGSDGYPGRLEVVVDYTLTARDEWIVDFAATTDRPTPVNLTQHSYFNLAGSAGGDAMDHVLTIDADRFTPVDPTLIPLGEPAAVAGTPFDFTRPCAIGSRIGADDDQLRRGRGYDHNFVLRRQGDWLARAARVTEPRTGRTLEVWTTAPGLQFYSGNFLGGAAAGTRGRPWRFREGFCLEAQHFPDSPNRPEFPSTVVVPGRTWHSRTVFAFGIDR